MRFLSKKQSRGVAAIMAVAVTVLALYLTFTSFKHKKHRVFIDEHPPPPKLCQRCFSTHRSQKVTFGDDDIVNPRFSYPINVQNACSHGDVEVILPIHSSITNFDRRNKTRHSVHGAFARNKWNKAAMFFFVGMPSVKLEDPEEFQNNLVNESRQYGDIIQININETYRNIVYKAIAVLQWVNTYCNRTDFVIKMDDDVVTDPSILLLPLYKYRNFYTEFVIGELRTNRVPERNPEIKWHMPEEQYSNSSFPPFVPGPVIGYPTSTARLLYQQALRTKPIWLDDVFITGICTKTLGIPVLHDDSYNNVHHPVRTENFVYE